jgi:hypothetical protein
VQIGDQFFGVFVKARIEEICSHSLELNVSLMECMICSSSTSQRKGQMQSTSYSMVWQVLQYFFVEQAHVFFNHGLLYCMYLVEGWLTVASTCYEYVNWIYQKSYHQMRYRESSKYCNRALEVIGRPDQ